MQIAIAGQKLASALPDDLDAKVIAATGCSVEELVASLDSGPAPSLVAELLHPCLAGKDAPAKPTLASLIAIALAEDYAGMIAQVRKVLQLGAKREGSSD
jgi:hypothetical protein